jgi:hypothetical protein
MNHVPMNHEEASANQMVERFALGELTGEDRERFEAHFFDCQECFDGVRLTSEFLHHTRQVLSREPEKGMLARLTADLLRPAPALVSALFLCVVSAVFYQNQKIAALSKPKLEARYFLGGQTRAPQGEKPIVVRKNVQLSLNVEFMPSSEFKSYQAQIKDDSGKVKYSMAVNPQEVEDSVSVVLSPESLKEGKYNLVIFGEPRSGPRKDVGGGSFYLQLAN